MSVEITTIPFDFQNGGDFPGDRGVRVQGTRPGAPGRVLSVVFPDMFISDGGAVEIGCAGGGRYPADDMLTWLDAVATAIRQHPREQRK